MTFLDQRMDKAEHVASGVEVHSTAGFPDIPTTLKDSVFLGAAANGRGRIRAKIATGCRNGLEIALDESPEGELESRL